MSGLKMPISAEEARKAWKFALAIRSDCGGGHYVGHSPTGPDRDSAEYVGYLGELAVCKAFRCPEAFGRSKGVRSPDIIIEGLRIEVKTSRLRGARLMLNTRTYAADVFVLVDQVDETREAQTVRIRGWMSRSEAMSDQYRVFVPWAKTEKYIVPPEDLHPIATLIERTTDAA